MMQHQITEAAGAHKRRRRVGRGESSGTGKTSGRGHKGCLARSGGGARPMHEGGQMPIFRRMPKRGFSNVQFERRFATVNLCDLERAFDAGATVNRESLLAKRLVQDPDAPIKLLGKGALAKKLTVEANACSAAAREAVEKAGGAVQLVELVDPAARAQAKRNSRKSATRERGPSRLEKKKARREART
ncbi:MAG: 50S ribosomal protein L15 [Planctomycetota bacterium]|nr:MAG: 50S ribosomal protein L15 [Planctomycetota bacterium]